MSRFGIWAAILTPVGEDGRVDGDRLAAHAGRLLQRGIAGVTLFGTTGEGASFGPRERRRGIAAIREHGILPDQIVLGLAATSVEDATAQVSQGLDAGIRDFLVPPPYYFRDVSDEGLAAWFVALIDASGDEARFIPYHIPQVTGVPVSVELLDQLVRRFGPRISAIKDSSGDWDHTEAILSAGRVPVLIGDERHLHRGARLGAAGSISGLANLLPERLLRVFAAAEEDPELSALVTRIVALPVVPALRALLAAANGEPEWERSLPPLGPLGDAARAALIEESMMEQMR